jgi:hypothetical protein
MLEQLEKQRVSDDGYKCFDTLCNFRVLMSTKPHDNYSLEILKVESAEFNRIIELETTELEKFKRNWIVYNLL